MFRVSSCDVDGDPNRAKHEAIFETEKVVPGWQKWNTLRNKYKEHCEVGSGWWQISVGDAGRK